MKTTQEHQQDVRQRIVEFAHNAFRNHGIKDVTMDHISQGLKMSKRTLYQYFREKDALVCACLDRSEAMHEHYIAELMSQRHNALEILFLSMEYRLRLLNETSPKFFIDVPRYPSILEHLSKRDESTIANSVLFFEEGVKQGYFLPMINYEFVSRSMLTQFKAVLHNCKFENCSLHTYLLHLCFVTFRGCATAEGVDIIDRYCQERQLFKKAYAAEQAEQSEQSE